MAALLRPRKEDPESAATHMLEHETENTGSAGTWKTTDAASGPVRLCRNWLGIAHRDAKAPSSLFPGVLAAFQAGDTARAGELLRLATDDPRLLGSAAEAILAWLRQGSNLQTHPRLAVELTGMLRIHRQAVAERNAAPGVRDLLAPGDELREARRLRARVVPLLQPLAGRLRGAWMLERRVRFLPAWRHWDIVMEVRPGELIGQTDVPERMAALLSEARSRLEGLWLENATLAVHVYPVLAERPLLAHMRKAGLVLFGVGGRAEGEPSPAPAGARALQARVAAADLPSLRGRIEEAEDADLREGHGEIADAAGEGDETDGKAAAAGPEAAIRKRAGHPDQGAGAGMDEGKQGPDEEPLLLSLLPESAKGRAVLGGGILLAAAALFQVLTWNDATHSRLAALEADHARLMAARVWRREDGADALDPSATLESYRAALRDYDATPSLPIYTAETRRFLLGRFRSRAGMEQEWQALHACSDPRISFRGDRAVIRFRENSMACAPFFFRRENGRWRLDLKARKTLLTNDHKGAWQWVAGEPPGEWRFAFMPQVAGEHAPAP
jgi:hypothetical protein